MAPRSFYRPPPPSLEEIKEMIRGNFSRTYYIRRCKRIIWSVAESIPDELLFEILLRVPAHDIYYASRFVCWKWYHMVRTKYFINKHLEHASYGLLYMNGFGNVAFISAREDGGIDTYKLPYYYAFAIWCSCNGLTLKFEEKSRSKVVYIVSNILTHKDLRLPPFPYRCYCFVLSGIGYVAASMRYKVVVPFKKSRREFGCAILTVGVDESWRTVRTDNLSFLYRRMIGGPIITEGFVHWEKGGGIINNVLSLNLETEIISETPPPVIPKVEEITKRRYMSTGRSLSLFLKRGRKLVWEVFEMKPEIGEWRKLANICLEGEKGKIKSLGLQRNAIIFVEPCGWFKYPEVLAFLAFGHARAFIVFYNLISCEIGAESFPTTLCSSQIILHKNSLVWF